MRKKVKRGPGRPPKNSKSTPKKVIVDQINEPRPLPMGRLEFEQWSDRIISGALIPSEIWSVFNQETAAEKHREFINSQKHALANMIMHLGPTESHKPDAHFIHSLRKAACNQVAHTIGKELLEEAKAREKAEEPQNEE